MTRRARTWSTTTTTSRTRAPTSCAATGSRCRCLCSYVWLKSFPVGRQGHLEISARFHLPLQSCTQPLFQAHTILCANLKTAAHEEVLARFDRDMDALAAADLHPAARVGGATRLLDLLPEVKLREWAAECRRSHRQFADKVHRKIRWLAALSIINRSAPAAARQSPVRSHTQRQTPKRRFAKLREWAATAAARTANEVPVDPLVSGPADGLANWGLLAGLWADVEVLFRQDCHPGLGCSASCV